MAKQWPAEAGTWNHRLEAVYRAYEAQPGHKMVVPVISRGLQKVKFVHPRIPEQIWAAFITTHNTFHQGSSASFKELLEEALKLEAGWDLEISRTNLHSSNPKYKLEYKEYVLKKSGFCLLAWSLGCLVTWLRGCLVVLLLGYLFAWSVGWLVGMYYKDWDTYRKALSLIHTLQNKYQIWNDCKEFWNKHVDFIGSAMDPGSVISTMHQVMLLVVGNMSKYYRADLVPKAASKTSGERLPAWTFKHWNDDATKMNLINMPMEMSVVVKKLTETKKDNTSQQPKPGSKRGACPDSACLSELATLGVHVDPKKMKLLPKEVPSNAHSPGEQGHATSASTASGEASSREDEGPYLSGLFDGSDGEEDEAKRPASSAAIQPTEMKLRKLDKKKGFHPFTDAEKAEYSKTVLPLGCSLSNPMEDPGSRAITALDDFMMSMKFVEDLDAHPDVKLPQESLDNTFSFCAGLWLQFVFESRVCVNGKELRLWSAARPEIQSTYIAAMDFMSNIPDGKPAGASTSESQLTAGEKKKLSALELARTLCETFVALPVKSLVMGDDESQTLRRIATVMSTQYAAVAMPLRDFLGGQFKLPLAMHDTVKEGVFEFQDKLEKFLRLRSQYLAQIIGSVLTCVPEFVLTDVSPLTNSAKHDFLYSLASSAPDAPALSIIASYDTTLSTSDWASSWVELLKANDSWKSLAEDCKRRVGLNKGQAAAQPSEIPLSRASPAAPTAFAFKGSGPPPEEAEQGDVQAEKEEQGDATKGTRAKEEETTATAVEKGAADEKGAGGMFVVGQSPAARDQSTDQDTKAEAEAKGEQRDDQAGQQPVQAELSNIDDFNLHSNPEWVKSIVADRGFAKLGFVEGKITPVLFKQLEHKLTAVMWDIFKEINKGSSRVEINFKGAKGKLKHESLQCKLPVKPEDVLLPCVNKVDFFMEPVKDTLATDFCLPAWASKVVSRADQAWFETQNVAAKIVIFRTGNGDAFDIQHINKLNDAVLAELVGNRPHFVTEITVQCLAPVSDIEEKVEKDLQESRKALEKNLRNWITNALKAKTKTVKGKKKANSKDKENQKNAAADAAEAVVGVDDQGLIGKDAEKMFESLGMEMPQNKQDQISALKNLLAEEAEFEKVITKAKEAILPLSHVPITKLSEDGAKTSNRSKLMQHALNAALGLVPDANAGDAQGTVNTKCGFQCGLKEVDFNATAKSAKDLCSFAFHGHKLPSGSTNVITQMDP
eukprot:s1306_g9.t1